MGIFYYFFQAACGVVFVAEYSKFVTRSMEEEDYWEENDTINNNESSEPLNEESNFSVSTTIKKTLEAHSELNETPEGVSSFVNDDVCTPFPWKSMLAFLTGVGIGATGVWLYEKYKSNKK